MKAWTRLLGILLVSIMPAGARPAAGALPASAPQPVSPGSSTRALPSPEICPTFSWGAPADVDSFELAVFETTENGMASPDAELIPVAVADIAGGGRSWTPSVDRCPRPGRVHVWFVRGHTADGATEWSSGSWFTSPPAAGPDRRAISALLAGDGAPPATGIRRAPAGSDRRSSGHALESSLAHPEGVEPEMTVQGEMIAGDITVLDEPGSQGRIVTDSEQPSQALGRLRASWFKLLQSDGSDGAIFAAGDISSPGAETLQIAMPAGLGNNCGAFCADLDVGTLIVERGLQVNGSFTFTNGLTGYLGSGGSGFFEVPSLTNVRVDNNAADCGARPVMRVRLSETDANQIGIQAICGNFP